MKLLSSSILLLFSTLAFAQVTENFSDGELTTNPSWSGNTADYTINAGQLQSNGAQVTPTQLYISTPSSLISNTQWEFWANPKTSTSSGNYTDIFLTSDLADIRTTSTNVGYFVRIGGTDDEVSLFRKTGANTFVKIIDGTNASIASTSNNPTKVKVTRNTSGNWDLLADFGGTGANFISQGSVTDNTYTNSAFFGILTYYSSSNYNKYYYDDIYVGPIVIDNTPPSVISSTATSINTLKIKFSELVSAATAQTASNYNVNLGIGNPSSVAINATDASEVTLTFTNNFSPSVNYNVTISNVQDLAGNTIIASSWPFTYIAATNSGIYINEIMADPDPVIGLPSAEYIELYNNSSNAVDLTNWTITIGSSSKTLSSYNLPANAYVVLCATSDIPLFTTLDPTIPTIGLSSLSISNTGNSILLKNSSNQIVHYINFTDDWYADNSKNDGGWSIEQIDPNNPCGEAGNWKASVDSKGGTPGKLNSVFASNIDNTSPIAIRGVWLNTDSIQITFNESLQNAALVNASNFTINNGLSVIAATPIANDYKKVKLKLSGILQNNTVYTVSFNSNIKDCAGNAIQSTSTVKVAKAEPIAKGDIIINEILFNPLNDGVDYVELYNKSSKTIDIKDLFLGNKDTTTNVWLNLKALSTENLVIFPNDFLLISTNGNKVKSQYKTENPNAFIDVPSLSTYSNTSGTAVLVSSTGPIEIDNMAYAETMQFPLLTTFEGVALERISYDRKSTDLTNWASASEASGFGTPGYKNSQYMPFEQSLSTLSIQPEIFSPDNDGYQDNVTFNYSFKEPSFAYSLTIYDDAGRLIKRLINNELAGLEGSTSWNGMREDNTLARVGIYIAYFEAFNAKGDIQKIKKTFVLAGKN